MNAIKDKVKAIIFDMDGTIVNTEQAWQTITLELLKCNGIQTFTPAQQQFLLTLSGMGLTNAVTAMKEQFNLPQPIEDLCKKKLELAEIYLSQNLEFIEGFEAFHNKLTAHTIPTSVATNATLTNLKKINETINLQSFFGTHMYCLADVNNKAKPDPALFLHAADKLGVNPSECIVFEDSLFGFKAAKAAGMKCIAIKAPTNLHLLDHVNEAIDSYHEAEDAIKKII
jgi:HAD superfamily hydrolase (TIGR01509 family)